VTAATVVNGLQLLKVAGYSLAAGIGVTVAFSLAVLGIARFADMRRGGRYGEAGVFAVIAVAGLAVSVAAVVLGVIVMATK
jgi:hypothetical protein